jgi:putative glutamine amidotransferase
MNRPVLGVTCCTRSGEEEPSQAVILRYLEAPMRHADTAALLVPSLPGLMDADDVAGRLDGLLLTGSPSNVDPARYGEGDAPDAAGPFDPARDAMTAALVRAMIARRKPVFGICRGFQELNVVLGGTLRRDTGRSPDLLPHHAPDDADLAAMFAHSHSVRLSPGGLLATALGKHEITVNSVHYQGVGRLAPRLTVEARAPDGLVEAFSARIDGTPLLAVQWHPEWDADTNPDSRGFFHILGKALRGASLGPNPIPLMEGLQ